MFHYYNNIEYSIALTRSSDKGKRLSFITIYLIIKKEKKNKKLNTKGRKLACCRRDEKSRMVSCVLHRQDATNHKTNFIIG